ncbi:MAG TPA: hypothetical protein VN151_11300 [Terracidiphilus sp.]|nr:hypothetical protein [Terracidiphilus sp.]
MPHGAELADEKRAEVAPHPRLTKDDRPARLQLDDKRAKEQNRQYKKNKAKNNKYIQTALHDYSPRQKNQQYIPTGNCQPVFGEDRMRHEALSLARRSTMPTHCLARENGAVISKDRRKRDSDAVSSGEIDLLYKNTTLSQMGVNATRVLALGRPALRHGQRTICGCMLLDKQNLTPFEVSGAKDRDFPVCCICRPVFSRNVTSEYNRRSSAEDELLPAGPGYRFPGTF